VKARLVLEVSADIVTSGPLNRYVVGAAWATFTVHAGKMKFRAQEEW
jgi:hypothetical protein